MVAERQYRMNRFKRHQSFPLRLSPSAREQVNEFARKEGISLNHFISLAVAEKISRLEHDTFLTQQKAAHPKVPVSSQPHNGLKTS
jgi:hypothetical protein